MANRSRTNSNTRRRIPRARVKRVESWGFPSGPKGREARAVLAVLALATLWPARFRNGWVRDLDFGAYARDIPRPKERDLQRAATIKALVRKGIAELKLRRQALRLERHTVGKVPGVADPREVVTRMRVPLPDEVEGWLAMVGFDLLTPEASQEFQALSYGVFDDLCTHALRLDVAAILTHLQRGDPDAAGDLAHHAMQRTTDEYGRRQLLLMQATAALAIQRHEPLRAIELLRPLAQNPTPLLDPALRALHARILITLAEASAMHSMATRQYDMSEAEQCLTAAHELLPLDDHSLRGDFQFTRYRVELKAGLAKAATGNVEAISAHNRRAAIALPRAIREWHLSYRLDRLPSAVAMLEHVSTHPDLKPFGTPLPDYLKWLDALWTYWQTTSLSDPSHHVQLSLVLLEVLSGIHPDTPISDVPVSPAYCRHLADRCIADSLASQDGAAALAIQRIQAASWYRQASSNNKRVPDHTK